MKLKYDQQKKRIIDVAFRKWAESNFVKTSLRPVAEELAMTKAALYRYFAKKTDLEEAMLSQYLGEMEAALDEFIHRHQTDPIRELIGHYYSFLFRYFQEKPYYCAFSHSYIIRSAREKQGVFSQLRKKSGNLFHAALTAAGHIRDENLLDLSVRYIQVMGFFQVMQLFMAKAHSQTAARGPVLLQELPEEMINDYRQKTVDYCLHGFVLDREHTLVCSEAIEKTSWIDRGEMLKADRIFSAIEEVISETGYANASVEKIAARIGINKSSLYFYFKNKNDMLLKTIKREQEHFHRLADARLKEWKTFKEKLYTFIVVLTSYTVNNPGMLTVLNWIRYQNIGVKLPKSELKKIFTKFDFIHQPKDTPTLAGFKEDPQHIFLFIFFLIMFKLGEVTAKPKPAADYLSFTRHIFALLCDGIDGQIKQKATQNERSSYVAKL